MKVSKRLESSLFVKFKWMPCSQITSTIFQHVMLLTCQLSQIRQTSCHVIPIKFTQLPLLQIPKGSFPSQNKKMNLFPRIKRHCPTFWKQPCQPPFFCNLSPDVIKTREQITYLYSTNDLQGKLHNIMSSNLSSRSALIIAQFINNKFSLT